MDTNNILYSDAGLRDIDLGESTGLTIGISSDNTVLPVTVAEFKTYGNVHITSDDTLIETIIRAVTAYGEAFTRLTWFNRTYVAQWETHARQVILPVGPHQAVSLVERIYSNGDAETLTLGADYFITGQGFKTLTFITWHYGLRVTFSAGYGATSASLPADLKLGVLKACLSAYEDRQNLAQSGFTQLPAGTKGYFSGKRRIVL